jgi:hypothetical protein
MRHAGVTDSIQQQRLADVRSVSCMQMLLAHAGNVVDGLSVVPTCCMRVSRFSLALANSQRAWTKASLQHGVDVQCA